MTACEHLVHFYDTDEELVRGVWPYLMAGLEADESVLVVATATHRLALEQELAAAGVELEEAITAGTFVTVDAADVLRYLQEEATGEIGQPDFDATMGMLVRRMLSSGRPLRVYGEIVSLLWDRGEAAAAVQLEGLWNELQRQLPFTLFCGYPVVQAPAQLEAVRRICLAHSFVLPTVTEDRPSGTAPVTAEFAPSLEAPRQVRSSLQPMLDAFGFDEDLIERLTLAASELAANAVLHARTPFRLLLQPRTDSVWIAVEDHDPLGTQFDVVGRTPHGLGLIAALAIRWGVTPCAAGKTVWAEIPQ